MLKDFYKKVSETPGKKFDNPQSEKKFREIAEILRRYDIPDEKIVLYLKDMYEYSIINYKVQMGILTVITELKPEERENE